ncbi:MAG: hypothetical protein C0615_08630 [Desulfuromonas sp.]|nr:MAG: hypothetical protein C0615_08630 [Desulfuromonas sp.]
MKNKQYNNWFLFTLLPWITSIVIRLIHATMRIEYLGDRYPQEIWEKEDNFILAFWHDQLLLMAPGYKNAQLKRKVGTRILISQSKDGELIARTMEFLGLGAVRGSSNRGGREALREMLKLAATDDDIVFTPDGPKGPRHVAKIGVAQIGKMTGRPVVPIAFVASRGRRFSSWDRFLFPYPFSRGVYAFAEPLYFQKGEELDDYLQRIEISMLENTKNAAARLEEHGVSAV